MLDANRNSLRSENLDWQIDELLKPRCVDRRSATQLAYCSTRDSHHRSTHIAKLLPASASEGQWLHFERQAFIALWLYHTHDLTPGLGVDIQLNHPQPIVVYPRLAGMRTDDWIHEQSAWVARPVWVALAHELLLQLESLHKLGYVHGHIRPEHVWIGEQSQVNLVGLGNCEPVGVKISGRSNTDRFDPPECQSSTFEATSAQDVYSAAVVIDLISGGIFSKTPVGSCMQANSPFDRPTSGELVQLFDCYRNELRGDYGIPSTRAA